MCQLGGAIGRVFWGAVSDRLFGGKRMGVLAFTGSITVACSLAMSAMGPGFPLWALPPLVFAYGASAVGWNGLYHVAMAEIAGQKYAATGVGMSMTLNQFGTFFGPPIFGLVLDSTGSYQAAWLLMSTFATVGLFMAVLNARGERRRAQAT